MFAYLVANLPYPQRLDAPGATLTQQKFPINRSSDSYPADPANNGAKSVAQQAPPPVVSGARQQQAPVGGVSPTRTSAQPASGGHQAQQQQQQFAIIADQDKLVPNGLTSINSFQLNAKSAKQCEIHHSILHPAARSATDPAPGSKKSVNFCRAWLNKFPSRSKRIDVISRIFFPKMFALFNLVYWTTYLFREDDIVQA